MPSAVARSLPKTTPDFGTVEFVAKASSWNVGTVALPEPRGRQFWAITWSSENQGSIYNLGFAEGHAATLLEVYYASAIGQGMIGTLRKTPGVAWPASFGVSASGGTYRASSAVLFSPTPGFRGIPVIRKQTAQGYGSSYALSVPANPMTTPGGLVLAAFTFDSGGSGATGVSGAGWVCPEIGGLTGLAYYLLPTDRVVTPPTVTALAGRSDYWMGAVVYLR